MSNLKELNYAIISELRDQLEAKEQMIKELKEQLEVTKRTIAYALDEFIYVYWNDKETRNKRRMKNIEKLEKTIGRFLKDDEVVHHINENKLDNTPENLLVLTQSEHIRLHANKRKRGKNGKFEI